MVPYVEGLLRYFELSGRSTRTQYFVFHIVLIGLSVAAIYADYVTTGVPPSRERPGFWLLFVGFVHTIPSITITVRRLHDSGRTGWWYLIGLLPLIGGLWLLVLMFFGPNDEADAYGDDPRLEAWSEPRPAHRRAPGRAEQMLAQIESLRARARSSFG